LIRSRPALLGGFFRNGDLWGNFENMEANRTLNCGVKFCGGCNPKYERMEALEKIKPLFSEKINFDYAKENVSYDIVLIIGGCSSCCASHEQYETKKGVIKMWDESHIENILEEIEWILRKNINKS